MPSIFYEYDKTYEIDSCNNIFNSTTSIIKGDYNTCSQKALANNSPFFILTGIEFQEPSNSNCIIPYNDISTNTILEWISNLKECTDCFDICNNHHYGKTNGYSLYKSPILQSTYDVLDISLDEFYQDFTNLITDISRLHINFINYKNDWYNNVEIEQVSNGVSDISQIGFIEEPDSKLYDQSVYTVNRGLYNLYNLESSLEAHLYQNQINYNQYKDRLLIINDKLTNSQNFFNSLMNKNSGAIGALDDSIYNTNVSIVENITLILVILISIYIYFKYIIN